MGRQPALAPWAMEGLIMGVQGGSERSGRLLRATMDAGIKVSGLWCQDWCGKLETSFGKRLRWNWQYDNALYPGLPDKIRDLHGQGIRFLGYINPYLVSDGPLYAQGRAAGYFAVHGDGSDYLVDFGEFYCGVVDLTNPQAFSWFKNIIRRYMIYIGMEFEYLHGPDILVAPVWQEHAESGNLPENIEFTTTEIDNKGAC